MTEYRAQPIRALARQLAFSPPERRRQHIDRAEQLYWEIDPAGSYPIEYLAYRITGLRAEPDDADAESEAILVGDAVQRDLLTLVDDLSATLADPLEQFDPTPLSTDEVAQRLGVTTRTIARYRKQGLFTRRVRDAGGRMRLAFLPASVDRFVASRADLADNAAKFDRMDEPTRHELIIRARRIRARVDVSPFRVARHLARKYGRSVETIRQFLVHHDNHDPRFAIFRERTPPLTPKQQRIIHRARRRGVPVRRLCQRFGKSHDAIYRAINACRARDLAARNLDYISSPTFNRDDAEEVILGRAWTLAGDPARAATPTEPAELAPFDAETEQAMFVRYNYLKYRAARIVQNLDRYRPTATDLDEAERFADAAEALRRHLHEIFEPVVHAVAAQHRAAYPGPRKPTLDRLVRIGRRVLDDTIEQYDPSRGRRFTAALTWNLMRRYAKQKPGAAKTPG